MPKARKRDTRYLRGLMQPGGFAGDIKRRRIKELGGREAVAGKLGRRQMKKELRLFDKEQQKFNEMLLERNRQATELAQARATGGVQRGTSMFLQRRGLEGGIAGSAMAASLGQLAGQTAQAQADFASQLAQAQARDRAAFLRGEFDFMHSMQAMHAQADINRELMQFQSDLQRDQQKFGFFSDLFQTAGGLIPFLNFGGGGQQGGQQANYLPPGAQFGGFRPYGR